MSRQGLKAFPYITWAGRTVKRVRGAFRGVTDSPVALAARTSRPTGRRRVRARRSRNPAAALAGLVSEPASVRRSHGRALARPHSAPTRGARAGAQQATPAWPG